MEKLRTSRIMITTIVVAIIEFLLFELIRAPFRPPYDMSTLLGRQEQYIVIGFMGLLAVAWAIYVLAKFFKPLPTIPKPLPTVPEAQELGVVNTRASWIALALALLLATVVGAAAHLFLFAKAESGWSLISSLLVSWF